MILRFGREVGSGRSAKVIWASIAGLAIVAGYAVLANDGRHHWHEFRYLYSATFYSTGDLMKGIFDPGPPPVRSPEPVAAWFVTELFHIYILKQFVSLYGIGLKSYTIIKALYSVMLVIAVGLVGITLRNLGMSAARALLIAGFVLLSPAAMYLGFKLMGEVPSLLFSAGALALFTEAVQRSRGRQIILSGLAGIGLTLSALSSARMPLLFLGFWVALLFVWARRGTRKQIVNAGLVTWITFLLSWPIGLWLLGGSFDIYLKALTGFLDFTKPLPMWIFAVFNLGLFGMGLWLLLPLAWLSPDERSRRFFFVWLALSGIPILVASVNFMEPRYLVVGVIPFAGLAALGLEALWERIRAWHWSPPMRTVFAAMLVVVIMGGTAAAQRFMPYETDENHLIQAVRSEAPSGSSTVILLPWNYTDFHLLRFLFPEKPVYLVQSPFNQKGEVIQDAVWTKRHVAIYGDRYLPNAKALTPFVEHRMLYMGWTILPSLQNLHDLLMRMGFQRLATQLEASNFLNHITQSWLWQNPNFPMEELARYGQYRVYEVRHKRFPSESNRPRS